MPDYTVTWQIEIFDAEDPMDAARQALDIQRDPDSVATCFRVQAWPDPDEGQMIDTEEGIVLED